MGKKMPAMDVFCACIRYLKEHLFNKCHQQLPGTLDNDIRWVLTVPAIWNDASKQFMREAAQMVRVNESFLILVTECFRDLYHIRGILCIAYDYKRRSPMFQNRK